MTYTQSRRPGKNLLSFVDDPTIRKLLADGNGPSFLICGSRGGQCPTICINGGLLMTETRIPASMRLVLATFGQDEFPTSSNAYTRMQFSRLASSTEQHAVLYHHRRNGHMPKDLALDIMSLVHIVTTGTEVLEDVPISRWARLHLLPNPL